ncbi:MAG: phosphotransferase [Gemmatimonadetes bacterium]|nr:phosphotransferase [Gemmatimonadota bacterium]
MQTSEQTKTNLRRYDSLTPRGQARRLRELAKSALRQFDIRVHRLELIKHLVNTTFRLRSDEGEFLVRIHREKNHTVRLVESELAWLLALSKEADVTVQTPYTTPDGRVVVLAEAAGVPRAYPVTMLSWIKGRIVPQVRRTTRHYEGLGRLVATLHKHAMQWDPPDDFERPVYDAIHQLGKFSVRPLPELGPRYLPAHVLRDMEAVYERRREAERVLGTGCEHFGLIHFDLSFSNILFYGGEALPIDFDACGLGFYAYDLGVALTGPFAYENFMARCEAVFRGYRQVLPLRREWIEYLPTFMASRTASYILHVAANPKAVESQWRSLLRPLLKASPDQFPS